MTSYSQSSRLPTDPGMETPLDPLPDPRDPAYVTVERRSLGRAVTTGFAYIFRSWRLLLFVVIVQVLLAATVVLPMYAGLAKHFDHHPHAPAMAGVPDDYDRSVGWTEPGVHHGVLQDVLRLEQPRVDAATLSMFWIVLLAWLFGAVVAGGVLGTLDIQRGAVPVSAFLAAGGANFGRMLRVGLVFALFWMVGARVVLEMWGSAVKPDEALAASEAVGWWGERLREGVLVLLFLWLRVAADLARVDVTLGGRRSAFLSVLRGIARTLRHPLRIPLTALVFGVPAFAAVWGLGFVVDLAQGPHVLAWIVTFLLIQIAVALRWAGRVGVLSALATLRTPADRTRTPADKRRTPADRRRM